MDKDIKIGFKQMIGQILALILLAGIVLGVWQGYEQWQSYRMNAEIINGLATNYVYSNVDERIHLLSKNKVATFFLNVSTNINESWLMGPFDMSYRVARDIEDGRRWVDVLYYVPEDWLITNATDFNVSAEFKMKNPPIEKRPRRDPTFYRGKDYPENIPFEEIEITTDFVTQFIDTNETEYDFKVRVEERSDEFNIMHLDLLTPEGVTIMG